MKNLWAETRNDADYELILSECLKLIYEES